MTETVENVKNLQSDVKKLDDNKITKFYTNNQGQKVLNDSDDGKIQDLVIYGKSEQKQYEGINLLNSEGSGYQQSGVTLTKNKDGTYTLDGKPTAGVWWTLCRMSLDAGQYKITGIEEGTALLHIVVQINNTNYGTTSKQGEIVTIPDNSEYEYAIWIENTGETYNNVILKPMVTKDLTATYDDYEPYTGGKPSPSPEYQQEIKAVVNPTIKIHGKNLIDFRQAKGGYGNGVTFTVNADGSINRRGTATGSVGNIWLLGNYRITEPEDKDVLFTLKKGKTYYIRECVLFSVVNGSTISYENIVTVYTKDIKINGIRNCSFVAGETYNDTIYPMVAEANEAVDWQPYQETQVTLPYELYAIPVSSGGNVTIDGQQYIADYVDVERGKLVKFVKKLFLKQIKWSKVVNNDVYRFYSGTNDALGIEGNKVIKNSFAISSHFVFINKTPDRVGYFTMNADGTYANIGFAFSTDSTTTSDDFNNWILNNKPFVLLETLKEEIDLTPDQIEAFKVLSTYYPKTYITAESEKLEAYTMFNYPVSMEKGWEYVKQQIGDTRKYVYNMDTKLTETEASTLEAKIDTAILSEMLGG